MPIWSIWSKNFVGRKSHTLRTLYIGGGTPTALSADQLAYLLKELTKSLDLSQMEELTIEANPGDLDPDKIAVFEGFAVNRVSLGVQTFDNRLLKKIGRSHQEQDIYDNIDRLKLAGFDNISIDLIYALPTQTMDQVQENVAKARALDIPHMSLYSLILENHTVFMNRMRRGKLPLPKEELEAEMFEYIIQELERAGFEHYEISNFSKPGFESRHNLMYWDNAEYYGSGSWCIRLCRWWFATRIMAPSATICRRSKREMRVSKKSIWLRLKWWKKRCFWDCVRRQAFPRSVFEEKFGVNFDQQYGSVVEELTQQGLLVPDKDIVRMTKKGLFLGDTVAEKFILE